MSEPIVHRNVALLRVSEPRVMSEIRMVMQLDDFILAQVSDTEIAVDPARLSELASLLADRGFAPLMKRAGADPTEQPREEEDTQFNRRRR